MNDDKWEDKDNDGIPDKFEDVYNDTMEAAKDAKKRFGTKNILIFFIILLFLAYTGVMTWLFWDLRDDHITLQRQYDSAVTENQIERDAEIIKNRGKLIEKLAKENAQAVKERENRAKAVEQVKDIITSDVIRSKNDEEAIKLDADDLVRGFNMLGIEASKK
jgi:hypothetical protein